MSWHLRLLIAVSFVGAAPAWAATTTAQKHFATPEAAVDALVAAVRAHDKTALVALVGSDAKEIVDSGDAVTDQEAGDRFVAAYDEKHALVPHGDHEMTLEVGGSEWPLPIPIVKGAKGWYFDGEAGEDEVLSRRIGRNELAAIQAALAFVDAEREYYARNPEGSPLLHYARRFISSSPDHRDGLYYLTKEDEPPSPLGPLFDIANAEGYEMGKQGKPTPYHGYYFKILDGQGKKAPGGAYSYLAGEQMIGGFALIAWPASYGNSGVMTFLVNHDGIVYQHDLGKQTEAKAKAAKLFDLEPGTMPVSAEDQTAIEAAAIPED